MTSIFGEVDNSLDHITIGRRLRSFKRNNDIFLTPIIIVKKILRIYNG